MRILGIDPGIGRCGWGIVEENKGKIKAVAFGCFETSPKQDVAERLQEIYEKLSKSIKDYSPDTLSIEELFFNTNAKTAFVVGQARGVILLAASENKLAINIYTPLQVKQSLTGYGKAEKGQIGKMVKVLLNLDRVPAPDDVSDALAVAITHAFSSKFKKYTK